MNLWMGLAERQVGGAEEGGVRFEIASKGKALLHCIGGERDGCGAWGKLCGCSGFVFFCLGAADRRGKPRRLGKMEKLLFSLQLLNFFYYFTKV